MMIAWKCPAVSEADLLEGWSLVAEGWTYPAPAILAGVASGCAVVEEFRVSQYHRSQLGNAAMAFGVSLASLVGL